MNCWYSNNDGRLPEVFFFFFDHRPVIVQEKRLEHELVGVSLCSLKLFLALLHFYQLCLEEQIKLD